MEDSYYVIFYNSNFLLNFNSYLSFLIPFIVYSKYISKLTKITFDISLIYFIIICLCFFYTVVYIINDWKDYNQDKKNNNCKRSAISKNIISSASKYFRIYMLEMMIIVLVILLRIKGFSIPFIIYFFSLGILGVLHTFFREIKFLTWVILRFIRICGLGFFIYLVYPSVYTDYFLVTLMIITPIWINRPYTTYLRNKNFQKYKKQVVFIPYYLSITLFIISLGTKRYLSYEYISFFIFFSILYWLLQVFHKLINKIARKMNLLSLVYKIALDKNSSLIVNTFINIIILSLL